jgi:hypothetical protein
MFPWRAATVYVVAAVTVTFPLAFSLTSALGAPSGPGDPYLNLWILGWGLRAWTTDPAAVWSGRVFDANIFFPAEGTLAYSDHLLLQSLALAPVYAASGNAVLCYNLLLIASIALSGLAMHLLTREVTGSEFGAYVAGLAWACWPYRTAHFAHVQLQALYFMPLALLYLHRVMAARRWRDTLGLSVLAALQAVSSVCYGLMTAVALAAASVTLALMTAQWRAARLWSQLLVAGVLTLLLVTPVLVPYVRSQHLEGFGRTVGEAARHSASLQSYTQVPPVNLVYGQTGLLAPRAPAAGRRDRTHVEHQIFPGFVLLALAVGGLLTSLRSDSRTLAFSAAALVLVGLALSFGSEGFPALYAVLHENVLGFQAIRAPARFASVAVLGLSLLAALAARALRSSSHRHIITRAVILGLGLEYLNAPLPLAPAPPLQTEVGQWLANEPTPGAVLHLPIGFGVDNTPIMVQSLEHGRPIVNGYSDQRPAHYVSLVENLSDLPSPSAFSALHELDVRFVVSPSQVAGAGHVRSPLVERARLDTAVIYEVKWNAEALAALEEIKAPVPPPPGRPPFMVGERAVYDVYWDSGPVDMPAGTATLTVVNGGQSPARWQFETRAQTADWMSPFFEARDVFTTITDEQFFPTEHRREIREGRRQVDGRYVFDRGASLVHTPLMALPLGSPFARDALSALYYVRTLALRAGDIIDVPLNEAGTSLTLTVSVAETEPLVRDGRAVPAQRLEPRIARRIERRWPIAITLWLSADEQRLPLRAVIDAGFARIRVELREYRS